MHQPGKDEAGPPVSNTQPALGWGPRDHSFSPGGEQCCRGSVAQMSGIGLAVGRERRRWVSCFDWHRPKFAVMWFRRCAAQDTEYSCSSESASGPTPSLMVLQAVWGWVADTDTSVSLGPPWSFCQVKVLVRLDPCPQHFRRDTVQSVGTPESLFSVTFEEWRVLSG